MFHSLGGGGIWSSLLPPNLYNCDQDGQLVVNHIYKFDVLGILDILRKITKQTSQKIIKTSENNQKKFERQVGILELCNR